MFLPLLCKVEVDVKRVLFAYHEDNRKLALYIAKQAVAIVRQLAVCSVYIVLYGLVEEYTYSRTRRIWEFINYMYYYLE